MACIKAVQAHSRACRQLLKSPIECHVIEYERLTADIWEVIKGGKKESWHRLCDTSGTETTSKQIWSMIHQMLGIKRDLPIPVLMNRNA